MCVVEGSMDNVIQGSMSMMMTLTLTASTVTGKMVYFCAVIVLHSHPMRGSADEQQPGDQSTNASLTRSRGEISKREGNIDILSIPLHRVHF